MRGKADFHTRGWAHCSNTRGRRCRRKRRRKERKRAKLRSTRRSSIFVIYLPSPLSSVRPSCTCARAPTLRSKGTCPTWSSRRSKGFGLRNTDAYTIILARVPRLCAAMGRTGVSFPSKNSRSQNPAKTRARYRFFLSVRTPVSKNSGPLARTTRRNYLFITRTDQTRGSSAIRA